MDILSIKGENIASLGKPFSIDLETGDLAGCGLFAITGKTGAGKSSLLDAMCLALYGDCPRLGAAGVNDTVPDASGEDIQSNDPCTILRRGTAAGHALVRFRGRDGIDYEVSWSVRRARGKPTGRLQNQERSLKRLSDGQVLENQIRRVNARVVELTGLTYEEFRRSVLLAQGDFDSFLSAKTSERAAILEKVTGTGLYREISRRVYAKHQYAESKVHNLELKLGEHTVLTEEEKTGITERQSALATRRKATETALKEIQVDLDHYTKLEEAREKLAAAIMENELAIKAWTESEADRYRLDRLRKAAAVRGEFRENRDARAAKTKATDELTKIEADLVKAVGEEVAARGLREKAQENVDTLEVRFKELGPMWSEAERLDARIDGAEGEQWAATAEVRECLEAVTEASNEAQEKRTQRDRIDVAMDRKQAKIEAEKAAAVFKDHWDILHDRLGRRMTCAAAHSKASDKALALEKDIYGMRGRIKEIDGFVAGREVQKKALSLQRQTQNEERSTIAEWDPRGRLSRLITSRMAIRGLLELARTHKAKSEQLQTHDEARAKLDETRCRAEKDLGKAVAVIADAESRIKALETPADMAEAAASSEARDLRRHLVDGEPCPVCQSTHHPLHDDAETAALAKRLRADLETARADWTTQSRNKVTQEGIIADAKTRLASMDEARAGIAAALDQTSADYAEAATKEVDGPVADQVPCVIADEASPVIARLEALRREMDGWKETLEAGCKRLDDLDKALEDLRGRIEAEEAAIATLRGERTGLVDAIGPQQNDLSRAESSRDQARDDIVSIDAELDARIGDAESLGVPAWSTFGAGASYQLTELENRRSRYMSDLDTIQEAATCRTQLDTHITILEGKQKSAREALGKVKEKAKARKETLDGLRAQRAGRLGGQPTGAHRTDFNEERKAAGEDHRKAVEAHGKAAERKAGLEASKVSATEALGTVRERAHKARGALTAASQRIEIPIADLAELLSDEQDPIDDRIAQLEKALGEIETGKVLAGQDLTTRQKDLIAIEKAHSPEETGDVLEDKKKILLEQEKVHATEDGDLKTRLALDAEARWKQAAIIKDLEVAKRDRGTWAAVNDTVGSASGDRFSQVAQEVTLSILVEQANHHLADIKPRYRLALGDGKLSLHVVDEDMAGEIRSTRSLSGGERFLVSLSLALALSSVGGTGAISGTLFIDEGFGTLDSDSLELAIDALEALQAQGRTVGVISHVQAMKDRIPMQVQVQAQGDGSSEVVVATS